MDLTQKLLSNLKKNNVLSQKGLIEMFDSTVGRSTVLMPMGGRLQRSETQVSVQKLPVGNHFTNTASMMAYGYNPDISSWSPYHGSQYAVVEAISKIVAAGGRYNKIRFSFQEYFEKMTENPFSWGKPTAALLGALQMQYDFCLPAIGGKDSMSGTFGDINVPPMLMAFGITTVDANNVISTDLKQRGNYLYCIKHHPRHDYTPDTEELKENYDFVSQQIENKCFVSAWAVGVGGIGEGVCKMAFGNDLGAEITLCNRGGENKLQSESELFSVDYGSIIVEANKQIEYKNAVHIGYVSDDKHITVKKQLSEAKAETVARMSLEALYEANTAKFAEIYPIHK